jgi:hypothetical protein
LSNAQLSPDFYRQFNVLDDRISRVERITSMTIFKDVNTAGLTSAQIDAAVFPAPTLSQPPDGIIITDTTNHLLLVREGGKWYKTAALTMIS